MTSKFLALREAVADCLTLESLGIGGATLRRKPIALVRELIRQGARGVAVSTWLGSLDIDLMIAAGAVRSVDSAYIGFGPLGLSSISRAGESVSHVTFRDWSESSFLTALRSGAQGLSWGLTRAILGTSLESMLGVRVESPFDGQPCVAVPAIRPDVVFLHAQASDMAGNIYRRRPNVTDDIDHVWAAAGRKVVVSVEEVATRGQGWTRDEVVIPGEYVSTVVLAPGGAAPTSCDGYYAANVIELSNYLNASRSERTMRHDSQTSVLVEGAIDPEGTVASP